MGVLRAYYSSGCTTGVLWLWDGYRRATATGTGVTDKTYGYCTGVAMGLAVERYGCGTVPSTAALAFWMQLAQERKPH